jgi:hypothetical protein
MDKNINNDLPRYGVVRFWQQMAQKNIEKHCKNFRKSNKNKPNINKTLQKL